MRVESSRTRVMRWLLGRPRRIHVLPGRPPAGPQAGPAADPADPSRPGRPVRAVCCSGGGIRSAAFTLGGLQRLSTPAAPGSASFYSGVDLLTAVSGGSYMASSFAILASDGTGDLPPYAPGSPEERRLRAHTRYLIEDQRVAAIGAVTILYGLLLNLIPLLAGLYVLGKLLGWGLRHGGLLTLSGDVPPQWQLGHVGAVTTTVAGVVLLGVTLFGVERLHDVYRAPRDALTRFLDAWTLRVLAFAAFLAVILLGVPLFLRAVSTTDINPGGVPFGQQASGFVATSLAIVGLVKGSLGRFKGKLVTTTGPSKGGLASYVAKAMRAAAPWAGSVVALGLLVVALLTWTSSAAYNGFRWREAGFALGALAVLAVWQVVTDVNRNSVHSFYRARLSSAFFVRRDETGTRAEPRPYSEPIPLESVRGKPALLVCAAVNTDEAGRVPSGRACAPWTFSRAYTGITAGTMFGGEPGLLDPGADSGEAPYGMVATGDYARRAGRRLVTLPGAVAVSGAAISPVMGRMTRAPIRILLGLANVRLGLWLPNPLQKTPPHPGEGIWALMKWQAGQPGPLALLREMTGRTSLIGRWVYVTDGGHYENLGLVEALRRGATEILVFDASGDGPDSWSAFGLAMQTARADLGVEIDLDPTQMRQPAEGAGAPTLVAQGTCTYPNGVRADLWLCKLALPEEASWDVLAWAQGHPSFPHDSTVQQLYGDREFEAYRALGDLAAATALRMYERGHAQPPGRDRRQDVVLPSPTDGTVADVSATSSTTSAGPPRS